MKWNLKAAAALCLSAAFTITKAHDADVLMFAAKINYMRAVESRCEKLLPGYSARFDASYAKAKNSQFFRRAGIDDALLKEAEQVPELQISEVVSKFDRANSKQQTSYCKINLDEVTSIND